MTTKLNMKNPNGEDMFLYGAKYVIASAPGYYRREALPSPNKTTITIAKTWVNINGEGHISTSAVTLNLNSASSWDANTYATAANRAGKDFYIYALASSDGSPNFILSANSTVPTGYTVSNSRKIGGFHCLCLSVGTISGHTLSGYVTGDILPLSVWDLRHRPVADPEGMVWIEGVGHWVDIYLNTWTGSKLVSTYNTTMADGNSGSFNGEKFAEAIGQVGKKLLSRDMFMVVAKGSNEMTNIYGSSDPGKAGGHKDTNNRRMISNYGLEDCCGVMYQWGSDIFEDWSPATWSAPQWYTEGWAKEYQNGSMRYYISNYQWYPESVYNPSFDSVQYGSAHGLVRRALLGGYWSVGSYCGSRCVYCVGFSADGYSSYGARGASEPASVNL